MKKVSFIGLLSLVLIANSCTDAEKGKYSNFGNKFKVELVSGGIVVRSWISTGKVSSESQSDGYYFIDSKTSKLVEISGDIIITNAD